MAGDPFGLLLRQRIVFLGGEASIIRAMKCLLACIWNGKTRQGRERQCRRRFDEVELLQVNDFAADAIISQLLLLDSQDPNKVHYTALSDVQREAFTCHLPLVLHV
jgi:hypothetical protein